MGKKEDFLCYKFELNCGGGGGPKIKERKLPNYRYESNCGGGGGPKGERSSVAYEYEHNRGGGGGPKSKVKDADLTQSQSHF